MCVLHLISRGQMILCPRQHKTSAFMSMLTDKSRNIDLVVDVADNTMDLREMNQSENLGAGGAKEFIERLQALAMKRRQGV